MSIFFGVLLPSALIVTAGWIAVEMVTYMKQEFGETEGSGEDDS